MANHAAITKHIVTAGDYNMVPAGQNLFDCPNCKAGKGGKIFFNVAPGQLVAYTIDSATLLPVTVDNTTLAAVNGDLYIGVGIDTDGDGAADDVRLLAGEKLDKCLLDETSVSSPTCGQPQILGAYIDCIKCWDTYTVEFSYSDNRTRSFGLARADQDTITAAFSPECASCDDCEPEANCDEVICKLVDSLNGEFDYEINGESYPDRKGFYPEKDYRAVRLHDNFNTYCINPLAANADCENCNAVDAILSATIAGTTVTFKGNLNPSDNTQTYIAQLKNIAQQIECGFEDNIGHHSGFAFVTGGGPDKCCPAALHVVTCDDTFVLNDVNGVMTPCTSIDAFPDFPNKQACVNCGNSAQGILTLTGNALNTETVVIGGKTYTFQDTLTDVDGNVLIGASASDTLDNLVAAINLSSGSGTTYATSTVVHPTVTSAQGAGDTVKITAKTSGTSGNSIATTETLTNGSFADVTLLGGTAVPSTASTTSTSCGLAVIINQPELDCGCYIDKPLAFYGRTGELTFIKNLDDYSPVIKAKELLAPVFPENFGAWIQWLEYSQETGGRGRQYRDINARQGWLGLPDRNSRANNAISFANCNKSYCTYYLGHKQERKSLTKSYAFNNLQSYIHIPSDDSNTKSSWETFYNILLNIGSTTCNVLGPVSCT